MSQAATICRSNFKVSIEAGRVLPEVRGRGLSSGRNGGVASTWGHGDGSAPCGPGASGPGSFPERLQGHRDRPDESAQTWPVTFLGNNRRVCKRLVSGFCRAGWIRVTLFSYVKL